MNACIHSAEAFFFHVVNGKICLMRNYCNFNVRKAGTVIKNNVTDMTFTVQYIMSRRQGKVQVLSSY